MPKKPTSRTDPLPDTPRRRRAPTERARRADTHADSLPQAAHRREWEAVQAVQQSLQRHGEFMSLAEAARVTSLPLSTLSYAARHGKLPAVETPLGRLVRLSAIQLRIGLPGKGWRKGQLRKTCACRGRR